MWYSARHVRHPVHPQYRVVPNPRREAPDMQRIPIPVIIAAGIIMALIAIALYGYTAGLWETAP